MLGFRDGSKGGRQFLRFDNSKPNGLDPVDNETNLEFFQLLNISILILHSEDVSVVALNLIWAILV